METRAMNLQVRVMAAFDLPAVNLVGGTSDPYASLTVLRTKQTHTTDVCLNTVNPTWYETMTFRHVRPSDVLQVHISDKNYVKHDMPLGTAQISVADALSHASAVASEIAYHPSWAPPAPAYPQPGRPSLYPQPTAHGPPGAAPTRIPPADAVMQRMMTMSFVVAPQGRITLVIAPDWVPDLDAGVPRKQFKRFQIHKLGEQVDKHSFSTSVGKVIKSGMQKAKPLNTALNILQPIHAVFQEHSTWKIAMNGVDDVFHGKRHGWNRNYDAAKKIFEGKGSIVARNMVRMQHAYLYGGASGVKPLQNMRKELQEVTGCLLDAEDFLKLMEYGVRRHKSRMFTYVLMPNRLYVAETGAKFFRDMLSKHAMHCSASTEVVYAGELHFRRAQPGSQEPEIELIIDNNSGTYAPGKEDLPKVEEVFRRNFPGLYVRGLDFKSPLLAQYVSELPPTRSGEDTSASQSL